VKRPLFSLSFPTHTTCKILVFLCTLPVYAHAEGGLTFGRVVGISKTRPVVAIDVGSDHGVVEGDRVVILNQDTPTATGIVIHIETNTSGVRIDRFEQRSPAITNRAIVIHSASDFAQSKTCELKFIKATSVDRVLPGGNRVWIKGGTRDGWQVNDQILIHRNGGVLGWGKITRCYANDALAILDRTREDGALCRRGDRVEAVGGVGESDLVRTRIAAVTTSRAATQLILAGDDSSGFSPGDRIELYRDGQYVSFATISRTNPVIRAEVTEAFQQSQTREGDVAILRPQPASGSAPLGRVFRVEGNHALITLGQADDIETGQTLFVFNKNAAPTRLTVRSVYPQHCGAKPESDDEPKSNNEPKSDNDPESDVDTPSQALRLWSCAATFAGAAARLQVSCIANEPVSWFRTLVPEGYCAAAPGEIVSTGIDGESWVVVARTENKIFAVRIEPDEH